MVVTVIADKSSVFIVGGKESTCAVGNWLEREAAIGIPHCAMRSKKLLLAVELKTSGVFFLVGNVGCGSGGDHHGARWQFDGPVFRLEANGRKVVGVVDNGFLWVHVLDERNTFFESL